MNSVSLALCGFKVKLCLDTGVGTSGSPSLTLGIFSAGLCSSSTLVPVPFRHPGEVTGCGSVSRCLSYLTAPPVCPESGG